MQLFSDTIQDRNGNVIPGATVTVTDYPSGTTSTTYATNAPGSSTNPITADNNGQYSFYAIDGSYTITTSKSGITTSTKVISLRDDNTLINVLGYGAVADGGVGSGTDNSAAFTAAFAAGNTVIVPPGSYSLKDVTIPTGKTLLAYGAYFYDRSGASYVFKLTGYSAKLVGAYISSATNCSVGAVVVDNGRGCEIASTRIVSATSGIVLKATTAATGCVRTQMVDVYVDTFTGVGLDIQANVSEVNAVNVYLDAGTISGGGALIPHTGTTGVKLTGTGSVVAFGGHRFSSVTAINCESGWYFADSTLTTLTGCIADGCSGVGVSLTGTTNYIDFGDMFVGSTGRAVQCSQTSNKNTFTGLRTSLTGVIPSWGGTTFYTSGGFGVGTAYDMALLNTSAATIDADSWWGDKSISVASGATLNVLGGARIDYCSLAAVPAATTTYLGQNGDSTTETVVQFTAPYAGTMFTMYNLCGSAPGAAQTFTYTLRKAGADQSLVGTISGAGVFVSTITGGPVSFSKGDSITLKLVTSAGAASAVHRGYLQLLASNN